MGGNVLRHPGLPGGTIENFDEGDLRELMEFGLLRISNRSRNDEEFEIRRQGFDLYDETHRDVDAPIAGHLRQPTEYVSSESFAARYREAFSKWHDADALLWQEESTKNLTTIGHLCREAVQLFATALVSHHQVAEADPDHAKTINRLRAVTAARGPHISSRKADLLEALIDYWAAVNGIVQRQEHGEQKGGSDLTWEDGQRVVMHTALLMTECDRVLG